MRYGEYRIGTMNNARPETISRIEPTWLEEPGEEIVDLVAQISRESVNLARLPKLTALGLAEFLRPMNCYYSNLIEGHNTLPRDIAQALENNEEANSERRDLQIEAKAHITLQREIDRKFELGELEEPASMGFIQWLHREFYANSPKAFLAVGKPPHTYEMVAGEFRSLPQHEVTVGRHQPPSSTRVPDFLARFEQRYAFSSMGAAKRIICTAIAHHRFNYIHPFPDGNGRVSRLMSYAMCLKAGIGACGLWSISRGLARGLQSPREYKQMMDFADSPRKSDLDGRGNLSTEATREFVIWFLKVCLDQIEFMQGLLELESLTQRLEQAVREHTQAREESLAILRYLLVYGEMQRGKAAEVTGLGERAARDVLAAMVKSGWAASATPKGPVHLAIPISYIDRLFPALYLAT